MRIGLLYAMKGEIESMLTEETPLLQERAGVSFYRIREDIIACCGGVGKVNAAMATQLFIDLYHPDLMMNCPSARWCCRIGSCSTIWIPPASATP